MFNESYTIFSDPVWINNALNAGNTGLWEITLNPATGQGCMYANNTMLKLLGLETHPTPEECYTWWFSRIDENYIESTTTSVMHAFETQEKVEVEYPWAHPHCGTIFVRCGGTPTVSDDGLLHIMGYHQDISDLQKARQSLRDSLSDLKTACRIGNIGVFQLLPCAQGAFTLIANSFFSTHFDVDMSQPAHIVWDTIAQRLSPETREKWLALPNWQCWQEQQRVELELQYPHPLRGDCWISLVCEYSFAGTQPVRAVGYITDITANKERELALHNAKEMAEAANLSKSTFLANMSHEIRTPMNGVLNMARLALNTELNAKQRNYISKIHSSGKMMLHVLNDILDFSKIEANRLEIENRVFEVRADVNSLLSMLGEWAHNKSLTFTHYVDENIPSHLLGDDLRVRQIVINLVTNAIKFTDKGSITLRLELVSLVGNQARIALTVQDMGIGMSEEQQKKLFTAFSQVDASITRRFGGTGLGLAISHSLASLMGGSISVHSALGQGSTFRLELPFTVPAPEDCIATALHVECLRNFSGKRALIVEDNDINQEILVALLEELTIDSIVVNNGQEAVDFFAQDDNFDCIFMDIQMPIMDGYTATKAIRNSKSSRAGTIPIIAMTANAMRGDDDKSLHAGMNAHLTKPLEFTALVSSLNEWL